MSLGNNTGMGQVRGKNKPILIRRIKEVVAARNYTRILASDVQARSACLLDTRSACTEAYYHDGSAALPQVGDKVYSRRRVSEKFILQAGHYKTTVSRLFQSFEVGRDGTVAAVTICRS